MNRPSDKRPLSRAERFLITAKSQGITFTLRRGANPDLDEIVPSGPPSKVANFRQVLVEHREEILAALELLPGGTTGKTQEEIDAEEWPEPPEWTVPLRGRGERGAATRTVDDWLEQLGRDAATIRVQPCAALLLVRGPTLPEQWVRVSLGIPPAATHYRRPIVGGGCRGEWAPIPDWWARAALS